MAISHLRNLRLSRPAGIAVVAFLAALLALSALVWAIDQERLRRQKAQALIVASDRAQALQVVIERAQAANYALAALVQAQRGAVAEFPDVARTLLPHYPGVSELALAPDGVIRAVYPVQGNEAAVGFDMLASSTQWQEAAKSRDSGQLTVAGPLDLVQGGVGIVGRLPVLLPNGDGGADFWGFTAVVMRLPDVLGLAQMESLRQRGYDYALWRLRPGDGVRQSIASSSSLPLSDPVEQTLQLPNGTWTLSVAPIRGWGDPLGLLAMALVALLLSVLPAWLVNLLLQLRQHKSWLESQIMVHIAELSAAKLQLESIFDSIPDLVWLKDGEGVYLNCNRQFERLTGYTREQILGRTDYDLFDRGVADFFRENDQRAILANRSTVNEESLTFADDDYQGLFETVKTPMRDASGRLVGVLGVARDITEHRQREEALHESEARLNIALEATRIGTWEWDLRGSTWYASPIYFAMLGYEPVIGPADRPVELARVHPDDRDELLAKFSAAANSVAEVYQHEARMRHADGSYRWFSLRGRVVTRDSSGKPARMLGVCIDISDLKAAEERVHWLAHHDLLTGLPNRNLLHARINFALDETRRSGASLALLFVDLDNFKNVNDTLGHRVGDELLVQVARRMQGIVRESDIVSRQGGDEFLLAVPGADEAEAGRVAEQLMAALSQRYRIDLYELVVTPSIGISLFPRDGDDFDALFRCADIAMYSAKRSGRSAYRFFNAELQARAARALRLENGLRQALQQEEFTLHYQPQVELASGRIIGVEALLRWHSAELGAVSPAEFIPVAEDSGQILQIGEWVLRTAVQQLKQWLDEGLPRMVVAVNLSAVQFRNERLPALVAEIVAEAQLPPDCLELELTERVAMDNPQEAIATMKELHALGIRLSIDDFGTGYSSLSYLKRFPISKLKIDRSFVQGIAGDDEDRVIVSAIIDLARLLGMRTIAEGVETGEQLSFLVRQGCNEVQGYHFSRPLPASTLEMLVRETPIFSIQKD